MIKKHIVFVLLIHLQLLCMSQLGQPLNLTDTKRIVELKARLAAAASDSIRIVVMQNIGFYYERIDGDSSLQFYNQALALSEKKSYGWGESRILASMSGLMEHRGRFAEAFDLLFKALKIAEDNKSAYDIARANRRISGVYFQLENNPKAVVYLLKALEMDEASHFKDKVAIDHYALADAYEKMNMLDSAAFHNNLALHHQELLPDLTQKIYQIEGHIQLKRKAYREAAGNFAEAFKRARLSTDLISLSGICADISNLFILQKNRDSAIFYALAGYNYGKSVAYKNGLILNGNLLATLYDSAKPSLALYYFKIAAAARDSLYGVSNIQTIQDLLSREEEKQKQLQQAEAAYREKSRLYILLAGMAAMLIIAFILYRNNRHKQKANLVLQQQKEKIEFTLAELRSTQAQLIQSEKMASLGELTAGIAHEIQNPLNFVNNFSEVSRELIDELKNQKSNLKPAEQDEILNDIDANLEKINHHGKRADAIVKGMLQHSRSSSGQKEPTDINALCDEYLRLAYHGLRAKDKSFNATLNTDFDASIGKVNIIPQDIGRVVMNLLTNAFYAVGEKSKLAANSQQPTASSTPKVSISTKKIDDKIEIKVSDNGNGVPHSTIDKIFQPFFTTKPTGHGTGLGLSLAYDMVKAHRGEILVKNNEDEGATFIIHLPITA